MERPLRRMEEYLASLPSELDAYPDCVQKASIYREFLGEVPREEMTRLAVLPRPLAELVERPPPVTTWIPAVHGYALFMAVTDVLNWSDEVHLAHKLDMNRRLLRSPLYRLLFLLLTPEALLANVPVRWAKFHRGVSLSVVSGGKGHATFRMEFPRLLVPDLQVRAYGSPLQAAVEAAGGKNVSFGLTTRSATHALYEGTWR